MISRNSDFNIKLTQKSVTFIVTTNCSSFKLICGTPIVINERIFRMKYEVLKYILYSDGILY